MALLTQWTWVWVNYRSWWCIGRPGVLQFMGSQRVGHNWVTELNWYMILYIQIEITLATLGVLVGNWPLPRGSKSLLQQRDTNIKNRLLDSVGEGKSRMIWENSIETCILLCVKQITSPNSMRKTGHSKPVYWGNPKGWNGEGNGRGFQDGGHM